MGLGDSHPKHLDTIQKVRNHSVTRPISIDSPQVVYAGDFFYLMTLFLSKCCVTFIYLEITPNIWHNRMTWAVFALSCLWFFASILIISIGCELVQA